MTVPLTVMSNRPTTPGNATTAMSVTLAVRRYCWYPNRVAGISTGPAPAAGGGAAVGAGPRISGGAPATIELGACTWLPTRPPTGGVAATGGMTGGAFGGVTGRGGATGGGTITTGALMGCESAVGS